MCIIYYVLQPLYFRLAVFFVKSTNWFESQTHRPLVHNTANLSLSRNWHSAACRMMGCHFGFLCMVILSQHWDAFRLLASWWSGHYIVFLQCIGETNITKAQYRIDNVRMIWEDKSYQKMCLSTMVAWFLWCFAYLPVGLHLCSLKCFKSRHNCAQGLINRSGWETLNKCPRQRTLGLLIVNYQISWWESTLLAR